MFEGSMTALITPFNEDGAIDWGEMKTLVEYQIEGGTDVLVPCGTTGESPTLSHKEHDEVIEKVIEYNNGRKKVLAGTGSNSTAEAISCTKAAKKAGADGALVVAPYYNKPSQEGIYKHYRAIAEEGGLPVIVYNIPGRTGINIAPETIGRLAKDCEMIVGVKEATGSLLQGSKTLLAAYEAGRSEFSLLSGDDMLTLPLMAIGGKGVISVLSNLAPNAIKTMVDAAANEDYKKARRLHQKYFALMTGMFMDTNPCCIKEAMCQAGLIKSAAVRPPLAPLSDETRAKMTALLQANDISLKA